MKYLLTIILFIECSLLFAQQGRLPALIPYRKGDKWGYCDSNKKILIAPQWKAVDFFEGTKARIVNDDKSYSLIDTNGRYIIAPSLHWTGGYSGEDSSALNCYDETGRWGMVDLNGVLTVPCQYERHAFENNPLQYSDSDLRYLIVIKNGKYGVIDQHNNILVPFTYDKLSQPYRELEQYEQLEAVRKSKRGIIDLHGNITAPFRHWDIRIANNDDDNKDIDSVFQVWTSVPYEEAREIHWKYKKLNRWWIAIGRWKEGYTTLFPGMIAQGMSCGGGRSIEYWESQHFTRTIDSVIYTYVGDVKFKKDYAYEYHPHSPYSIMRSDNEAYGVLLGLHFVIPPQTMYKIISGNIELNMFVVVKDGKHGVIDSALNMLIPLQQYPIWELNKVGDRYYARSLYDNAIINNCGEVISVFKERHIKSNYPADIGYQPSGSHKVYMVEDRKTSAIGIVSTNDSTWYPAVSFKYRSLERIRKDMFIATDAIGDTTHSRVLIDGNNKEPFPGLIPYLSWNTTESEKYMLKGKGLTKVNYQLGRICTDQMFFYISDSGIIYADDPQ
jgi:hypothetical protein